MSLPKPFYDHDGITIYHGDCREILPELPKVDLVLTDPPYGLGDKWQGGMEMWPLHHGVMSWDASIVAEVPQLIQHGRQQIVWGGHLYSLPQQRGWMVWDKLERNDAFTSGQAEVAWSNLDQPIKVWRMHSTKVMSRGKEHPTQKPVGLMLWCMKFTDGETVLDPFMGSGTTLCAAKELRRQAIGIEIEEHYCEIAVKRLSQEVFDFGSVPHPGGG